MSGNEAGTTVGIGDKSDGSLEVVVSSLSEGLARSFNILINPDESGQLDLIDLVYFIDYYSNMAADLEYSEDTKICFDRNTLNIRCEEVSEEDVITSLSVSQRRWSGDINIGVKWTTAEENVSGFNLQLFEGDSQEGSSHNIAGNAKAFVIMFLKPSKKYLIRLEATLEDGSKSVRILKFRTKGL